MTFRTKGRFLDLARRLARQRVDGTITEKNYATVVDEATNPSEGCDEMDSQPRPLPEN